MSCCLCLSGFVCRVYNKISSADKHHTLVLMQPKCYRRRISGTYLSLDKRQSSSVACKQCWKSDADDSRPSWQSLLRQTRSQFISRKPVTVDVELKAQILRVQAISARVHRTFYCLTLHVEGGTSLATRWVGASSM